MGAISSRKGANGERELAELLRQHGYNIQRGGSLSFGEAPDLTGLPGIHVEVKRRENVNLSAALDQAQRDSERFGGLPCVFHRANRKPWAVSMPLESWLQLYEQAHTCKCGGRCLTAETGEQR